MLNLSIDHSHQRPLKPQSERLQLKGETRTPYLFPQVWILFKSEERTQLEWWEQPLIHEPPLDFQGSRSIQTGTKRLSLGYWWFPSNSHSPHHGSSVCTTRLHKLLGWSGFLECAETWTNEIWPNESFLDLGRGDTACRISNITKIDTWIYCSIKTEKWSGRKLSS